MRAFLLFPSEDDDAKQILESREYADMMLRRVVQCCNPSLFRLVARFTSRPYAQIMPLN